MSCGGRRLQLRVQVLQVRVTAPPVDGKANKALIALLAREFKTPKSKIAIVLRYGGFYGPGTWYAHDGAMAAQMRARSFPIIGSGQGITSFVHVDDAAAAAVDALRGTTSGIYNIVDDEPAAASDWMPKGGMG